jgi:hypothetical protein
MTLIETLKEFAGGRLSESWHEEYSDGYDDGVIEFARELIAKFFPDEAKLNEVFSDTTGREYPERSDAASSHRETDPGKGAVQHAPSHS